MSEQKIAWDHLMTAMVGIVGRDKTLKILEYRDQLEHEHEEYLRAKKESEENND